MLLLLLMLLLLSVYRDRWPDGALRSVSGRRRAAKGAHEDEKQEAEPWEGSAYAVATAVSGAAVVGRTAVGG